MRLRLFMATAHPTEIFGNLGEAGYSLVRMANWVTFGTQNITHVRGAVVLQIHQAFLKARQRAVKFFHGR